MNQGGYKVLSLMKTDKTSKPVKNVEDIVQNIQEGDIALREQFIIEYKPFILKCASKYSFQTQNIDKSDEFSIALIAFNEAINSYKSIKGMSFLGFSEIVIKNRLNDNARKNRNQRNVIPFTSLESDDTDLDKQFEIPSEDTSFRSVEIRDEILSYTISLKEYGVSFNDLVRLSPKHQNTRIRLIELSKIIYGQPELLGKLKRTKSIPIRELLELTSICRGTIEQHRKYIIALVLILDSSLETLKGYITYSKKGGELHAD